MPQSRRTRCIPRSALAAAAALVAGQAFADSGSGVDTAAGNAMNPAGMRSTAAVDPEGSGISLSDRTPTGLLRAEPLLQRAPRATAGGWLVNATVEVGGLKVGGDKGAAGFGEYKALDSGLYVNHFALHAEQPAGATYVDVIGGAPGERDAYLAVTAGRWNAWRIKAFYSEIDHVFTSSYRNLWSGTGTDRLTLNSLPAGPAAPATAASTDIAIGNAALATSPGSLSVLRKKGGLRLDLTLSADWKAFAALSSEQRRGARPFGLVSAGGGGTGGLEIPETVDYDTHDVLAGLQWSNAATSVNVLASASMFRNNVGTLTVDNPLFLAAANGIGRFPQARFDLYPDNDLFNVKAEFAHAIPALWRARLTGLFSASSSRQDDALIPSTPHAGAVVNGVAGGSWDTTASLSRSSAGARIDTRLIDVGLALNPLSSLELRAKWRRHATDNKTEYFACNPVTGQWGRLTNDGSGGVFAVPNATAGNNPPGTPATAYDAARCNLAALKALNLVPAAGNVNIRNVPYEHEQDNASLSADWALARSQNLSAALERETIRREHRERAETWEDKARIGYVNRALPGGTLRVSLEHGRRRGSTYMADPYDEFYSSSFGGTPVAAATNVTSWIHANDRHRKYDLADRDSTTLNLRANHALRDDLDVSLAAQIKEQRWPASDYGRNGTHKQHSLSLDATWQPSERTSASGFVALQDGRMNQAGLQQNACVLGTTYYFYSDGSVAATATPTAAQLAAGVTVLGNSGAVTGASFMALCGGAMATSPLFPTSRTWTATHVDRNVVAGLGLRQEIGPTRLDLNYSLTQSKTRIGYTYNAAAIGLATSGAPTAAQLAALALIGNGFPDIRFRQHTVDASLWMPVNRTLGVRLLLRHEVGTVRDWHYEGVAGNPTPGVNQQTYLDGGAQDWRTTVLGAMLQISW